MVVYKSNDITSINNTKRQIVVNKHTKFSILEMFTLVKN